MTAHALASLMGARPTGSGRWQARCPAHQDRSPSLSIHEGYDGRTLLHCFAGCPLDAILAALKLARRDLFAAGPPSLKQAAALRTAQEVRLQAARAERKARLAALDHMERLQAVVNALGAKLARLPDDDEQGAKWARLFHAASDRHREASIEVDKFYPMRRRHAQDKDGILENAD